MTRFISLRIWYVFPWQKAKRYSNSELLTKSLTKNLIVIIHASSSSMLLWLQKKLDTIIFHLDNKPEKRSTKEAIILMIIILYFTSFVNKKIYNILFNDIWENNEFCLQIIITIMLTGIAAFPLTSICSALNTSFYLRYSQLNTFM